MDKVGLIVSNGSDRGKIDVDATYLEFEGVGEENINLTVDFAAGVAMNGLAAGQSENNSSWYSVWAAVKPSCAGGFGLLLQEGFTKPTVPAGCEDYTILRMLAPVYNDASGDLLRFHHRGREWWWDENTQAAFFRKYAATAPAGSTALSLAGPMPSISAEAIISIICYSLAAGIMTARSCPGGGAYPSYNVFVSKTAGALYHSDTQFWPTNNSQVVDHFGTNIFVIYDVLGFIWE